MWSMRYGLCRLYQPTQSLNSSIGKHMRDTHAMSKLSLINNFLVLKKCRNKFDCLIHEMLIIQDLSGVEAE